MKILNFKKYIFSYTYIFLGILIIISYFCMDIFLEPAPNYSTLEPVPPMLRSSTFSMLYLGSSALYLCCCCALIIEILIRKVLEKIFPNLKSPFLFTIPKETNKLLSVIFYMLFSLASLPLIYFIFRFFS